MSLEAFDHFEGFDGVGNESEMFAGACWLALAHRLTRALFVGSWKVISTERSNEEASVRLWSRHALKVARTK